MRNHLRNLWNDKRGNALILAAAALPLLLGSAGLATDTIQWALWKRQLQRAADSAAIAGVYDRVAHAGGTTNVSTAVDHDLGLNQHTNIGLMSSYPQLSYPARTWTGGDWFKLACPLLLVCKAGREAQWAFWVGLFSD